MFTPDDGPRRDTSNPISRRYEQRIRLCKMIGRQLDHPSGVGGRLVGHVMAVVNRQPNQITIDALKIAPGDTVLELGFGPGRAIRTLDSMVPHGRVLGIDHSAAMLDQAARYNRRAIRIGRVELRQGRFDGLPWDSNTVDKILAVNVVYFFRPEAAEIREARRVLRPGGMMAIYATDKSAMARWKFCSPETHRIFDRNELLALIMSAAVANDEVSVISITLAFNVPALLAVLRKGTAARE
jgi:SAM-dependent methyltransferase